MESDFGIDPNDLFPEKSSVEMLPTAQNPTFGGSQPEVDTKVEVRGRSPRNQPPSFCSWGNTRMWAKSLLCSLFATATLLAAVTGCAVFNDHESSLIQISSSRNPVKASFDTRWCQCVGKREAGLCKGKASGSH